MMFAVITRNTQKKRIPHGSRPRWKAMDLQIRIRIRIRFAGEVNSCIDWRPSQNSPRIIVGTLQSVQCNNFLKLTSEIQGREESSGNPNKYQFQLSIHNNANIRYSDIIWCRFYIFGYRLYFDPRMARKIERKNPGYHLVQQPNIWQRRGVSPWEINYLNELKYCIFIAWYLPNSRKPLDQQNRSTLIVRKTFVIGAPLHSYVQKLFAL